MITQIDIKNFKSIKKAQLPLKPLTLLVGTNSSGKSSIIQSLLLYSQHCSNHIILQEYLECLGEYRMLLSVDGKGEIEITPHIHQPMPTLKLNENGEQLETNELFHQYKSVFLFEKNLYYISANRIGQENIARMRKNIRSGINGEFIFGFYEENKNKALPNQQLIYDVSSSTTMSAQVTYWLKHILDLNLNLKTEKINNAYLKVAYGDDNIQEISPFNLGAGVSYLSKILILGLSLKKDNILIVENPEVHLHPKAIVKFADFFVALVNAGVQVILETHSEHILNAMRYAIFKKRLSEDKLQIHYREHIKEEFVNITINQEKAWYQIDDKSGDFPSGFFDSDLKELWEMF